MSIIEKGRVGRLVRMFPMLVLFCLLIGTMPVVAAMGTPVTFDATPDRCIVAPRSLTELERILNAATPVGSLDGSTAGDPIDLESDTGRSVSATIEQLIACLNAGDRMRAYRLYTDAYLSVILQPGDLPSFATPYPADDDEQTRIVSIDLRALPDGRVFAQVTLDPALIPVQKIFGFILIQIDGQWLLDDVINEIDFSLP